MISKHAFFLYRVRVTNFSMAVAVHGTEIDTKHTVYPQSQVRVFIFITWYKAGPAWTHALEGPHFFKCVTNCGQSAYLPLTKSDCDSFCQLKTLKSYHLPFEFNLNDHCAGKTEITHGLLRLPWRIPRSWRHLTWLKPQSVKPSINPCKSWTPWQRNANAAWIKSQANSFAALEFIKLLNKLICHINKYGVYDLHKMTEIEDVVSYHLDLTEENQNSWHLSRWIDPIYCSDHGTNRTVVQISQPDITLTSQP